MLRKIKGLFKPCNHFNNPKCPHAWHLREEYLSSVTHLIALGLALAGMCLMLLRAYDFSSWHAFIAGGIYGLGLLAAFGSSAIYHGVNASLTLKRRLRLVDHLCVFFFIASCYTPFALVPLHGVIGWSLLVAVWFIFALGVSFKLSRFCHMRGVSIILYLAMGWLLVFVADPLVQVLPRECIVLMVLGGLSYTIGIVFYLMESVPYMHVVWHLFVILGALVHYISIYIYIIPLNVI